MAVLSFHDITKEYRPLFRGKRTRALDGFTLQVPPGEIFGFLGPNGAGKTTAIHLALGFMRPNSGSGEMLGKPFGNARQRCRVGFLAENVALYPRNAEDVVAFYGQLNGLSAKDALQRSRKLIGKLGLAEHAQRNVKKFSRGMLQRIGLAQALINDPDLLILDETTSALDPNARVMVRETLLEQKRAGKTVFVSSHLLSEIEMVSDRVAFVRSGRIVLEGKTTELLESGDGYTIQFRTKDGREGAQTIPSVEQRKTIERIWLEGGEVLAVNPQRRTLEALFLELTGAASGKVEV